MDLVGRGASKVEPVSAVSITMLLARRGFHRGQRVGSVGECFGAKQSTTFYTSGSCH